MRDSKGFFFHQERTGFKMAGMSGSSPYAVLGTREFSRVRQFDMEERRKRILGNPKYKIAVPTDFATIA